MKVMRFVAAGIVLAAIATAAWPAKAGSRGEASESALASRLARLEAVAAGQGEIMSSLGYHFANLWFAIQRDNWPLADFYLHECREALEQAVAAEPERRLSTGASLSIKGIAEALDATQFTAMEKTIAARDRPKAEANYRLAMTVCTSCHTAAEKPFLRVRVPDRPPAESIDFSASAPGKTR